MISAMKDIYKLRKGKHFEVDSHNRNRYRILVKENVGTTAYCFSTPIYNTESRKLVLGAELHTTDYNGTSSFSYFHISQK